MLRPALASLLILAAGIVSAPADNLLRNADFQLGSQNWHGDCKVVFLLPDGTEGKDGDKDATAVMKIGLSKGHPVGVYQVLQGRDIPPKLSVSLQIYASPDFKRSTHNDDYVFAQATVPVADFVARIQPDFWEQQQDLKPGQWVTLSGGTGSSQPYEERALYLIIPPGDGYIYIKAPSLAPSPSPSPSP